MKNCVVQGASRGLGREFVRQLLARGDRVFATCRDPAVAGFSDHPLLTVLPLDLHNEGSIEEAASRVLQEAPRLDLLINAAGPLHGDGWGPEKRLRDLDPEVLQRVFAVNAFGPLLVAKHFAPGFRHRQRAVIANLSARVGSISDNRLGGWYAYRGSKAAQNMFTKGVSIELGRRNGELVVVALHPGTVATGLSAPFSGRVPEEKLFSVDRAARQLLDVIDGLGPDDTGGFFAWDGQPIEW